MVHDSTVERRRRAAARRETWQFKVLAATNGNKSRLGAIVIAALGNDPILEPAIRDLWGVAGFEAPRFVSGNPPPMMARAGLRWGATVSSDGMVFADFLNKRQEWHRGAFVGAIGDLTRNFRGLADHLHLNDTDRLALFNVLRQWIIKDWRSNSNLELGGPVDAKK